MAKKHEPKPPGHWTTLEELLLVYAVKRHGTRTWDAIAKELQSRVSMQRNYVSSSVITPHNCRDEFLRLRRRFTPLGPAAAAETEEEEMEGDGEGEGEEEESCLVPMLEELRRIRIEELRREVKRHDVSIVLLESKIKRLEQERERSLTEETDLRGQASERGELKASPAILAGESSATAPEAAAADESDDRSYDESNSTGQKPEFATALRDTKNDAVKEWTSSAKHEPGGETGVNPVQQRTEPDRDRDSSSRFKNADNDADKRGGGAAEAEEEAKATRAGPLGESNDLRDSVSDSKREGASSKQSSDVQSSASLSKKKRRRKAGAAAGGGRATSCGDEEAEIDEVSPASSKRVVAVKPPEPLVDLLRKIRSHRLGSAFERRLRIQESERYRKLIRQHMDLRIIESRLERGAYSDCSRKFYRDLLLLFNNAIVFHRNTSSEYAAAIELRALVTREMKARIRKRPPASVASLKSKPIKPVTRPAEPVAPLKSKSSKPVIGVCGKRSFVSPGKTSRGREIEEKKQEVAVKENKNVGCNGSSIVAGKSRKERSGSNPRSTKIPRPTTKGSNNNGETKKREYGNNELSSHDAPVVKSINAKQKEKKKQGAVSFLRRMKQSASTESEEDRDGDVSGSEGEEEEEKGMGKKGKKKEGVVTRSFSSSSAGKGGKEENGKGKRYTGRPVRRAAVAAAAGETTGKRGRENSNGEGSGGGGKAKKRVRR